MGERIGGIAFKASILRFDIKQIPLRSWKVGPTDMCQRSALRTPLGCDTTVKRGNDLSDIGKHFAFRYTDVKRHGEVFSAFRVRR
jgi:hypothetical protein